MDYSTLLERLKPHWLPILLGVIGFVFLLYGLISFVVPKKDKPDILFEAASDVSPLAKTVEKKRLAVDVEGAVEKPGVYDLPFDARVQDALIAAGGMSEKADRSLVAKSLNLAAKVADGGKIYIPAVGDPSTGSGLTMSSGDSTVLGSQTGLININSASAKDLDSLPGIGEVTAQKIISNRPYSTIDELISKNVVSQKVYGEIKDRISVY